MLDIIELKKMSPLNGHQKGLEIQKVILQKLQDKRKIVIDFDKVDFCTDSFIQELTSCLIDKMTLEIYKKEIKFKNANKFIQSMIKEKVMEKVKKN